MARVSARALLLRDSGPLQRLPWLWYDFAVARMGTPYWVPSVILLFVLLLGGLTIAAAGGQLSEAVAEPRFWLARAYPAFCSVAIGYAPDALVRLIDRLRPWLDRPDQELAELQHEMSHDLIRFFWIGALVSGAVVLWFASIDPAYLEISISAATYRNLQLFDAAFYAYFCGSATPILTWGVWLLITRLRSLEVKPGFILNGGQEALRPFNQFLIVTWAACIPTMGLIVLVALMRGVGDFGATVYSIVFLGASVVAVILPQVLMSDWLQQLRARDLAWLRGQLEETAAANGATTTIELQRALLAYNWLTFRIDQVRTASITLIDTKFVIQVATSVTAIVLANVLLRALRP